MVKTTWVQKHRPLTLKCDVNLVPDSDDQFTVEWRKDYKLIFSAHGTQDSGHTLEVMQGRVGRASNLSLTIHSINDEDKGIYQCIVTKYGNNGMSEKKEGEKIHLIVHYKPLIISPSPAVGEFNFMNIGQPFSYECKVQALPPAEITWLKNDRIISDTSNLTFSSLRHDHQGTYECLAVNLEGSSRSTLRLELSRSPIIDTILQNKTVIEGESVYWNCIAQATPNNITYQWLFNDKKIRTLELGLRVKNDGDGELGIMKATRLDRGKYDCIADNGIREPVSMSVYLDVLYKPTLINDSFNKKLETTYDGNVITVVEGNDREIICDFDANPKVSKIIWTKSELSLAKEVGNRFKIVNATARDGGIISCQGFNELGHSEAYETHVIVVSLPRFTKTPPPKYFIKIGEKLHIECDGFGSPPPLQYWLRKSEKTYSTRMVIERVSHDDTGLYECVLSNQEQIVKKTTEVFVTNTMPQPSEHIRTDCQYYPTIATILKWTTGYDGGSSQKFKIYWREKYDSHWYVSSQQTDNFLQFENLEPFAEYEIKIESQNIYGSIFSPGYKINSCSLLIPPKNIEYDRIGKVISWKKTEEADNYKISFRTEKMKSFASLAVVKEEKFIIPNDLQNDKNTMFYIQSLRNDFPDSIPSNALTINFNSNSHVLFASIFLSAAIFCVAIFLLLIYWGKTKIVTKILSNIFFKKTERDRSPHIIGSKQENQRRESNNSWNFQPVQSFYSEMCSAPRNYQLSNSTLLQQMSHTNSLPYQSKEEHFLRRQPEEDQKSYDSDSSSSSVVTSTHQHDNPFQQISSIYYQTKHNHPSINATHFSKIRQGNQSVGIINESPITAMMRDKYIYSAGTIDKLNILQELRVEQLKYEFSHSNKNSYEHQEQPNDFSNESNDEMFF